MAKNTKNIKIKFQLESLLSVNALLAVVIALELLIALYLIVSQNYQLKALYNRSLEGVRKISEESTAKAKQASTSASLLLQADAKTYLAGEPAEVEVVLTLDKPETISAIEGRLKYDPNYIKINNIVTRSLFKKAADKDDPAGGVFYFAFYSEDGQKITNSLGLATVSFTPLRQGATALEFVFSEGASSSSSTVMRYTDPTNLLQKVNSVDIVIE
ncbi:MAG: cohesin domain-containing protein [bacterium]